MGPALKTRTRIALVILLSARTMAARSDDAPPLPPLPADPIFTGEEGARTRAFRARLLTTMFNEAYMLTYAFVMGTSLAGDAISSGEGAARAESRWLGVSVAGGALGVLVSELIAYDNFGWVRGGGGTTWYRTVSAGTGLATIPVFSARSRKASGSAWTARAEGIGVAPGAPGIGYRLGGWGRWFGADAEFGVTSFHTTAQTASYDAQGYLTVPVRGGSGRDTGRTVSVPVQLGTVELPNRFLMFHSLAYGANAYGILGEARIRPYLGAGAALLVNTVQSEYPGPANLTRGAEALALNDLSLGWSVRLMVGARAKLGTRTFGWLELRPAWDHFSYDSGQGYLAEHDSFTMQTFQIQFGLGLEY